MFFSSPLEQFSVYKLIPMHYGCFDLSITNSSLFAIIASFLIFFVFTSICSQAKIVPTVWQSLLEMLYEFVFYNVVSENIKKGGGLYFPILFSVFLFILFCNLLGMVPYGFTVTSHIIVTLGLALTIFIGINMFSNSNYILLFYILYYSLFRF